VRVEILIVARVDLSFVVGLMDENQVFSGARIQMTDAMAGGRFEAGGKKNRQRIEDSFRIAAP
jgi:hypothetical protein